MSEIVHALVERYGLIAVFVGCLAEGESIAILAGFFAHQDVFGRAAAAATVYAGAFLGDTALFFVGRRFANHPRVARFKQKPGFAHAYSAVRRHPNAFVFFNRYVYGMRAIGGFAAGMAQISVARFVLLNALSCLMWTALFVGLGYMFGLGVERVLGAELLQHERLVAALVLLAVSTAAFYLVTRRVRGRRARGSME